MSSLSNTLGPRKRADAHGWLAGRLTGLDGSASALAVDAQQGAHAKPDAEGCCPLATDDWLGAHARRNHRLNHRPRSRTQMGAEMSKTAHPRYMAEVDNWAFICLAVKPAPSPRVLRAKITITSKDYACSKLASQ